MNCPAQLLAHSKHSLLPTTHLTIIASITITTIIILIVIVRADGK